MELRHLQRMPQPETDTPRTPSTDRLAKTQPCASVWSVSRALASLQRMNVRRAAVESLNLSRSKCHSLLSRAEFEAQMPLNSVARFTRLIAIINAAVRRLTLFSFAVTQTSSNALDSIASS